MGKGGLLNAQAQFLGGEVTRLKKYAFFFYFTDQAVESLSVHSNIHIRRFITCPKLPSIR